MISLHLASIGQTKAHQYVVRFLVGGLCTVVAGVIGKHWGPLVGGLFLAFPAIFPAGASLIESHEKENKKKIGQDGRTRGRLAASIDSAGAALGSIALIVFAITSWLLLSIRSAASAILIATLAWVVTAVLLWQLRRHRIFRGI